MSGQGRIGKRIAILHEIGFADPLTMAQKNQAILTYTPDAILAKIAEMRELGFSDPVQMITSNPTSQLLAQEYSSENREFTRVWLR